MNLKQPTNSIHRHAYIKTNCNNANLQLCEYACLIPLHHSQSNTTPVYRSAGTPSYLKKKKKISFQ